MVYMTYGRVYVITNFLNGKIYVGQTVNSLEQRWRGHIHDADRGRNYPLHNALRKYGTDNFTIAELATATSQEELNALEQKFVAGYRSNERGIGYNVRAGGDGGGSLADSTRKKISARLMGHAAPNKGKPMPEHQYVEMVARQRAHPPTLGKHWSDEIKAKIGAANKISRSGVRLSDSHRRHIGDGLRRYYRSSEQALENSRQRASHARAHRTPETFRKIADAQKGKRLPAELIENLRILSIGKKHTEETKRKIGDSLRGKKKAPFSLEHRRRISEANRRRSVSKHLADVNRGKKHTAERRARTAEAIRLWWAKRKGLI
jgi:group I intron endonuclease